MHKTKSAGLNFILILFFMPLIWSCSNNEIDYRDLKWDYINKDPYSGLKISISDSVVTVNAILFFRSDSLNNEIPVKDSTSAKIISWEDGLIILDDKCENLIDDTLFYEVYSTENASYLLLSVTKIVHLSESEPAFREPISMALTNEQNEIVKATDFWDPFDLEFEGYKCGSSIAWNDLAYFGFDGGFSTAYGNFSLRQAPNITVRPSNGVIVNIVKNNIPFSEVSKYVNIISSALGEKPRRIGSNTDYPVYTWHHGFTDVYLLQTINWAEGVVNEPEYQLSITDSEIAALSEVDALQSEEDKNQRLMKEKVLGVLQRAVSKKTEQEIYKSLDSAIQIDPSCYIAYYYKASYKFDFQNISGAKIDCKKAFALNEYDQPTLELLLLIYLTENNNYDAKTLVQKKEKWINSTARSAALLGDYYRIVEQNLEKACQYYNLAYDRGFLEVMPTIKQICQ